MKSKNSLFKAGFVTVLALTFAFPVFAAEFITPIKNGDPNVTISASETHKNLYTAGANVNVNGKIMGDLVAAGGMVNLIGEVEQDAMVAGGSLSFSGSVGGDARVAGGNITISSPIGGDLFLAGGNVSVTESASVGGDVVAGVGNFILDAPVGGKIKIAGGNITINSKVVGDVEIFSSGRGDSGKVVFGPNAEVMGKINHKGPSEAIIMEGAQVSTINYTHLSGRDGKTVWKRLFAIGYIIQLVGWFLAGLVLIRYRKTGLATLAESFRAKPFENLGLGLAGFVVIPIVIVVLFVTLVGYYIAAFLALWYILLLMLACLLSAILSGAFIYKRIKKSDQFIFNWKSLALGVLLIFILKLIPVLGWIAIAVLSLMVIGTLLRLSKQKWNQET